MLTSEQVEELREKLLAFNVTAMSLSKQPHAEQLEAVIKSQLSDLCDLALQSLGGWQPIATAPKDGTHLLMLAANKIIHEAWWRLDIFEKNYEWGGTGWSFSNHTLPTHWQPLPSPPEGEHDPPKGIRPMSCADHKFSDRQGVCPYCTIASQATELTEMRRDAEPIRSVLTELLRLYDWRKELGLIERQMEDEAHSEEAAKQMRKDLLKYGREKKAAWELTRKLLSDALLDGTREKGK